MGRTLPTAHDQLAKARLARDRTVRFDVWLQPRGRMNLREVQSLQDLWLEKIQEPAQVERLLEAFAMRSGLLPEKAYRVRDPVAFPEKIKRLLAQASEHASLCFLLGSQSWLFTGMVSVALSQERNAPVLWVNAYSGEGALIEVGAFTVDQDGKWHRYGEFVRL